MNLKELYEKKIKMWWAIIDHPKMTESEKKIAAIKLHKAGELDCDSDSCGRCAVHSSAEIAAEREELKEYGDE